MKGVGVSPGIAIGKVFVKKEVNFKNEKYSVSRTSTELDRLNVAIEKTKVEIDTLYEKTLKNLGKDDAEIFVAHKMMLEDPEFISMIKGNIVSERINAEWAVIKTRDTFVQLLENIEVDYIKERSIDVKDVSNKLLMNLSGNKSSELINIEGKCIIVSNDLTPSNTAQIDIEKALGFVTEAGGKTSHTSIMARSLELPAVVGVKDITNIVKNNDTLIVDGNEGLVIINPTEKQIKYYRDKKKKQEELSLILNNMKGKETVSKDGVKVKIVGNIGTPKDINKVIKNDGEGVGLYRTEFLYMDRNSLPTEEEQFKAYKFAAEKLEGKPVVIRTLDVGGDIELPYLNLPKEKNPFLGYRGIRYSLDKEYIFKTQLRAILRATAFGNIKIMLPMISSIDEISEAKAIIKEIKTELEAEDMQFNENVEIGIMVETPAAAIQSDILAKEVDFFSIGTNDLIQYTLAVDRSNQNISLKYSQYHPSVLRLIKLIIDNGHKEGIKVGMCGEAAGDEKLIPIFLGMGLDEFSMSSTSILKARWIIRNNSKSEMGNKIDEVLNFSSSNEIEKYINEKITIKI